MHGRKRDEYKAIHRDPNMVKKLSMKAMAWHTLQNELLQRQKQQNSTDGISTAMNDADTGSTSTTTSIQETVEGTTGNSTNADSDEFTVTTLVLLEKAVTVNPDPIWLWNFRRTLVQKQLTLLLSSSTSSEVVVEGNPPTPLLLEQTSRIFDTEYGISQLGLQNNPKAYAVWHYRKWCIQQHVMMMLPFVKSSTTSDMVLQLLHEELHLCNLLLQKDERNFHCWSYRRYIVSCFIFYSESSSKKPFTTTGTSMTGEWKLPDIDSEDNNIWMGAQITIRNISMQLPTTVSADEQHLNTTTAATYNTTGSILQQEWEFTTTKIYENFSNFSAFHYRSKLFPLMIQVRRYNATTAHSDSTNIASTPIERDDRDVHENDITFQMIKDEFDLITNAIYTEPDDQTAWWYQVFLFHYLTKNVFIQNDGDVATLLTKYNEQIIQPHMQQVRELQDETKNSSKWVLIGTLQCLEYVKKYHVFCNRAAIATDDDVDFADINQERRTILQTLIHIDPDRKERYRYKLQQIHSTVQYSQTRNNNS